MAITEARSVSKAIQSYWSVYGGLRSVVHSPYLWCAVVIVAISFNAWTRSGWWETALNTLPDLLGFSVGAFAIFLAFGDDRFRRIIAGQEPGELNPSPYMRFCGTFMHFIAIQLLAILAALVCKSEPLAGITVPSNLQVGLSIGKHAAWLAGYLLFVYSLLLCFATAIAIFRVARQYDGFISRLKASPHSSQPACSLAQPQASSANDSVPTDATKAP